MVRNIVYTVILAVIVVVSWQTGSIMLEKQSVGYLLEKHANSAKKYGQNEIVKKNLREDLERKGLPTEFTVEELGRRKAKIVYQYYGAATVFGYTYYQTAETLSAVTAD